MRLPSALDLFGASFLALQLAILLENTGVLALSNSAFRKYQDLASLNLLPDGSAWHTDDFSPNEEHSENLRFFSADNGTQSIEAAKREVIRDEYVTLPIDHFGDTPGTFENRFWVAEADYKPGGPIFIYDVGEANGSAQAIIRLQNETSFFKMIVKKFNGMGIVWEHRFYGNSSPYNVSLNTPSSQFKYLTAEQALADVPTFAWQFKRNNFKNIDLTPASTPWVFIGGSYPGMRAAFVRKFYPGSIFASYASSAPVEASVDMSFYFDPMWRGLNDDGFGNCTKDIRAAVNYIDDLMDRNDPKEYGALFERFLGRGAANNTRSGFADALTTVYALYQSYGVDGVSYNMRGFCDHISHDPVSNKTAPAEGWAATKGANFTVDRWANWPYFAYVVNDNMYTNCEGPFPEVTAALQNSNMSVNQTQMGTNTTKATQSVINVNATSIPSCDLQLRFPDPAAISWTWQYCTQWGFMQSVNYGERQMCSKYNSLQHQKDICHRQFPDGRSSGLLPEWPRTKQTNSVFGGWNIKPTNTFWTGGQYDPWRTLSPLSDMDFSPKFQFNQTVPQCGSRKPGSYDSLFALLIPDAGHAYDFRGTWNGSVPARELWNSALTSWLKCFTKYNPFAAGPDSGALQATAYSPPASLPSKDKRSTSNLEAINWNSAQGTAFLDSLAGKESLPLGEEGIDDEEQVKRELARVRKSWAKVEAETGLRVQRRVTAVDQAQGGLSGLRSLMGRRPRAVRLRID